MPCLIIWWTWFKEKLWKKNIKFQSLSWLNIFQELHGKLILSWRITPTGCSCCITWKLKQQQRIEVNKNILAALTYHRCQQFSMRITIFVLVHGFNYIIILLLLSSGVNFFFFFNLIFEFNYILFPISDYVHRGRCEILSCRACLGTGSSPWLRNHL